MLTLELPLDKMLVFEMAELWGGQLDVRSVAMSEWL